MKPMPSKRLNLSVQYASSREGLPVRAEFVRWARAALVGGGEVTIRLVDADEGRALNNEYRSKDYATNVLSFPYETEPVILGDLVICPSVVGREAAEMTVMLRKWKTKKGRFSPRWVIATLIWVTTPPKHYGL